MVGACSRAKRAPGCAVREVIVGRSTCREDKSLLIARALRDLHVVAEEHRVRWRVLAVLEGMGVRSNVLMETDRPGEGVLVLVRRFASWCQVVLVNTSTARGASRTDRVPSLFPWSTVVMSWEEGSGVRA